MEKNEATATQAAHRTQSSPSFVRYLLLPLQAMLEFFERCMELSGPILGLRADTRNIVTQGTPHN